MAPWILFYRRTDLCLLVLAVVGSSSSLFRAPSANAAAFVVLQPFVPPPPCHPQGGSHRRISHSFLPSSDIVLRNKDPKRRRQQQQQRLSPTTTLYSSFLPHVALEQGWIGGEVGDAGSAIRAYIDIAIAPGGWEFLLERPQCLFAEMEQGLIVVISTFSVLFLLWNYGLASFGIQTITTTIDDDTTDTDTNNIAPTDENIIANQNAPWVIIGAAALGFALVSGTLCVQPFSQGEHFRINNDGSWTLERRLLGWNRTSSGSSITKIQRLDSGKTSLLIFTDTHTLPGQHHLAYFLPVQEQDVLANFIKHFILESGGGTVD